jgi:hypothetical protein
VCCRWFFFRVSNVQSKPLTLSIMNASKASYPEGWKDYNACCSYDRITWRRVPTTYDEESGHLVIKLTPEHNSAYFAYFAPYTLDMHMHLIAQKQLAPQVKLVMLGETLDGHDLDMLVVGNESPEKKKIWVIARQHPGETMAEWFVEGLLDRLTDRCTLHISGPLMCPSILIFGAHYMCSANLVDITCSNARSSTWLLTSLVGVHTGISHYADACATARVVPMLPLLMLQAAQCLRKRCGAGASRTCAAATHVLLAMQTRLCGKIASGQCDAVCCAKHESGMVPHDMPFMH